MTPAAVAFAAGAALLQQQAALPPLWLVLVLVPFLLLAWRWPKTLFAFTFCLGFAWAALLAHERMAERLAPALEGRDLEVVGVVSSLPAIGERSVRFELDIESSAERLPSKVLVSWYRGVADDEDPALLADAVHPGERWLFTVRLRRPHGNVNPSGFDYEAWI